MTRFFPTPPLSSCSVQSFKSPPTSVLKVVQGLRVALADPGNMPSAKEMEWKALVAYMHNTREFLGDIILTGPRDVKHPMKAAIMDPYFADPDFHPENASRVSGAAGKICRWLYDLMEKRVVPIRDTVYGERAKGKVSGSELLNALIKDVKRLKRDLAERWKRYEDEREDERLDLEKDHLETEYRAIMDCEVVCTAVPAPLLLLPDCFSYACHFLSPSQCAAPAARSRHLKRCGAHHDAAPGCPLLLHVHRAAEGLEPLRAAGGRAHSLLCSGRDARRGGGGGGGCHLRGLCCAGGGVSRLR